MPPNIAFAQALRAHQAGRLAEAEPLYREILTADPAHSDSLHLLGVIAYQRGDHDAAAQAIRAALAIDPAPAAYHYNLGNVLAARGEIAAAIDAFRAALDRQPDYPEARFNLGNALAAAGRAADAAACYRALLAARPDYHKARNNLGGILREQGALDEAAECYRHMLAHTPGDAAAIGNLGCVQLAQGQLDDAVASLRRAVALQPQQQAAHVNLALALLTKGDLAAGWEEYEWRRPQRGFTQPQWCGEAAAGKTLLIHAEQGYGDTIQFCRYAPQAAALGMTVYIEAPAPLVRLLRRLPDLAGVIACGEALPDFDLHCPLLSLPRAFAATLADLPECPPYLQPDPETAAAWRARLDAAYGDAPRIGLHWAGGKLPPHAPRDSRSLPPALLAPLFAFTDARFFSLQKDFAPAPDLPLIDLTEDLHDFADTAALIAQLDLVIAIDSAVAHLTAALGKPVWLLDRFDGCWRWLRGRRDCVWYPTLCIYRQPAPGDWNAVIATVARDLAAALHEPDVRPTHERAAGDHAAGDLAAAEAGYLAALSAHPLHTDSLRGLGTLLAQTARPALAVERLGTALTLDPSNAASQHRLAGALAALGRHDEAIGGYRRALARAPDEAAWRLDLALALHRAGRFAEAEAQYHEILARDPDHADGQHLLGVLLDQTGQTEAAVARLRAAIAQAPGQALYHYHLGIALGRLGQAAAAAASYRAAIARQPDHPDAHAHLALVLKSLGRPDEAVACYRAALAARPDDAEAMNNLGVLLRESGRIDEAIAMLRRAVAANPQSGEIHYNLGSALLSAGQFEQGWQEAEWRLQMASLPQLRRDFAQPQWRGEPADGQTLLIHAEQGFGDSLQFCRYATLAAARGLRVCLEVPDPLVRLLGTLAGVASVVARGETLPQFDLHCPMLSLPLACATTLETIPAETPYLHADPAAVAQWRARLARLSGARIGLVWAGQAQLHPLPDADPPDRRRSLTVAQLAPLLALRGVQFFSLQKDQPAPAGTHDLMGEMADFADTAALIEMLDVVISVDTAVAHLAGALGRPVWLLDRFDACWRWLPHSDPPRRDSPWYPSLRIYRQPRPGDWDSVIASVIADLRPRRWPAFLQKGKKALLF